MSFANFNTKVVDANLVEKILEQGQRLRNSMVESILRNDPFCTDVIYSNNTKHFNTPRSSSVEISNKKLSEEDSKRVETYLRGEFMSKEDEKVALDTIRSMSVPDLFKTTERSLLTNRSDCKCSTCAEYCEKNLNCDLRRSENIVTQQIKDKYLNENIRLLHFVDSLKISVHSLLLNESGIYKVFLKLDSKSASITPRYFLEYSIPEKIVKKTKNKSKVDSGLDHNFVRICSRQNNDAIIFKHIFLHDVTNLDKIDLENVDITFKISYRTSKLKNAELLGYAKFNFGSFKVSKNLTCNQELPIFLEDHSIVVGHLKTLLQFGCGKLYFGKEFIEAINVNNKLSIALNSEDEISEKNYEIKHKNVPKKIIKSVSQKEETVKNVVPLKNETKPIDNKETVQKEVEKQVLFGFIYISESQFNLNPINSYVSLQPFCQNETCYSLNVPNSSNPVYNFCQLVPLIYDDELLLNFRENYTLLEFWEKNHSDNIFGLARLPLHQFYLAYRNPVILKYLSKNKHPIISSDGWEPIYSLENEEIIGQVQVLVALGTEEQIKTLEIDRGFKNNVVRSRNIKKPEYKPPEHIKTFIDRRKLNEKQNLTDRATNTSSSGFNSPKKSLKAPPEKIDVAIQSESEMDDPKKISPTQEMLGSFLTQILAQKQRNICVENATNTENIPESSRPHLEVRRTTDLLDTLQKALSPDSGLKKETFKARIAINNANQLPIKRRYKSKKTRSRKDQIDEALPSTYVTFETLPGSNLKITQVVPKSASPKYDYNVEVELPVDLLTNNQKKLVFKVWKKSTNITNTPNLQTDIIIGFATLDLTVLLAGLPNVQGWFNIIDFSGKCNGQINIHVNPLEDLSKFQVKSSNKNVENKPTITETNDESNELLSRTLKRKFTELDEITQRLRLRLSEVTKEDSDCSNDELEKEFEEDINTLSIEDDFNLINFDKESKGENSQSEIHDLLSVASAGEESKESSDSSNFKLDKNLLEGKQKIDSLLEKLTLISNDALQPFGSRYVSGCSIANDNNHIDTEAILKELDKNSRPNIRTGDIFDSEMFKHMYEANSQSNSDSASGTSILTTYSDFRMAPEGQGNTTEKKN